MNGRDRPGKMVNSSNVLHDETVTITTILSKDTGFSRPYCADPYSDDYYKSNQLYFPVSNHRKCRLIIYLISKEI